MLDALHRPLQDLRISVTDRCNFRCGYCMPSEVFDAHHRFLPRTEILSFEEILRVAQLAVDLGVKKIRLTGGEPLLRKDITQLVAMLAAIPDIDLTLTTNGTALPTLAGPLRAAGLQRITLSMDALDDATFRRMNDVDVGVESILRAIDAAERAGFANLKINMVVQRGVNDQQILPMATHFRGTGHVLRFIEYMDVGHTNQWQSNEVFSARDILQNLQREYALEALAPAYSGEVAKRWRYVDGAGEIGIIASVTQPFCGDCTRLRLSTDGQLFTCLFAHQGHDLRARLRSEASNDAIQNFMRQVWQTRSDRYSELRGQQNGVVVPLHRVEMSYIGG